VLGIIACPHWRQMLPKTATNCRQFVPETATNVAENGNKSRCFRQHLLPETETFVAVSGDNLSPFRATFVAVFGNICCRFWHKLATICRRFRQHLSPVWTGYYA